MCANRSVQKLPASFSYTANIGPQLPMMFSKLVSEQRSFASTDSDSLFAVQPRGTGKPTRGGAMILGPVATVIVIAVVLLVSGLKILKEFERAVVFRLGRLVSARGPGVVYVIPFIEKMQRIELRTITLDVPAQDVITRDN